MSLKIKEQRPKIKFFVVCIFAIFGIWACGGQKANQVKIADSRKLEAAIFRQHCAICHGPEAEGKDIGGRITPSLRVGDAAKRSEEEIYKQIYNGGNGMTPFNRQLSEREIRDLARFIKHDLQGN